jgi:hypothetical protein
VHSVKHYHSNDLVLIGGERLFQGVAKRPDMLRVWDTQLHDNNLTENAIRPFVLGRKNWLFSDTVKGARASANLYSMIETAKANGLEPYQHLRYVFTPLPKAQTLEQIEALLPYHIDLSNLSPY